jgi:hypothetical protein
MGNNLIPSKHTLPKRGHEFCRVCGSSNLFTGMRLGELPIANELARYEQGATELFDLTLMICPTCGLGQVGEEIPPVRLFGDYRYMSSVSSIFLEHARGFVAEIIPQINKNSGDWVLEIASNDGYLLQFLTDESISVLGVEPATNIAEYANKRGIPTLNEFFSAKLAKEIFEERGFPKFVVANNVLAHVPDINDFVEGISVLTGPDTKVSIENPSIMNILEGGQFDTIYHEHFSYLSANSMQTIARINDLSLYEVEEISIHGGSNRYWLSRTGAAKIEPSVKKIIDLEILIGLFSEERWNNAQEKMERAIVDFRNLLKITKESGGIFCGYGAAAKSSTILNMVGVSKQDFSSIADESTEKQGRYLPSMNIPIESPAQMFERNPTDIVIFPWNIEKEIKAKIMSGVHKKVNIWKLIPKLSRIN